MKEEPEELKRWKETTEALLGSVEEQFCKPYSIAVVPDELRKWNEKAYEPSLVSIGPRYKGRRDLRQMEKTKWRCILSLLRRTKQDGKEILNKCMEAMLRLDAAVRASYADEIKLDRYELATTMVYDGCFLLELLIAGSDIGNNKLKCIMFSAGPGAEVKKMEEVLTDLILVENQIPLFVLYMLFQLLFPTYDPFYYIRTIEDLALSLFGYSTDGIADTPFNLSAHFLELDCSSTRVQSKQTQHSSIDVNNSSDADADATKLKLCFHCCEKIKNQSNSDAKVVVLKRCATRLQAAGVSIKHKAVSKNMMSNDSTVSRFHFEIGFNKGTLTIPQLHITEETEARWRNFIAWEHHKKKSKSSNSVAEEDLVFTSSSFLYNDLICCASDIQLLKNRGVIVNDTKKSNQDLVTLFHSITKGLDRDSMVHSSYRKLFQDLNNHSTRNFALRIFIYFEHFLSRIWDWFYGLHDFLKRGYNFAFLIGIVLTAIQTFYAVLAYHRPPK